MKRRLVSMMTVLVASSLVFLFESPVKTDATGVSDILPASGAALVFEEGTSIEKIQEINIKDDEYISNSLQIILYASSIFLLSFLS